MVILPVTIAGPLSVKVSLVRKASHGNMIPPHPYRKDVGEPVLTSVSNVGLVVTIVDRFYFLTKGTKDPFLSKEGVV
jgi:hypothetical protein